MPWLTEYAVKLYHVDWCNHCKKFMPIWDQVQKDITEHKNVFIIPEVSNVYVFEKIDCTKVDQKITAYPTVVMYDPTTNEVVGTLEGSKDYGTLKQFILDKI